MKGKLSFKLKGDTSTNIKDKITLCYKRHNPRLRPIPSVKSDKTQWGGYKSRPDDGKIHRIPHQSYNRACRNLFFKKYRINGIFWSIKRHSLAVQRL